MKLPTSRDETLLLHNPKCSKSRATLALLEERGIRFETRRYLEDPLSPDELESLSRRLGLPPLAFTRTGQAEFESAGLTQDSSPAELVRAIAAAPILMERPIVVRGERAAVGRPPENVLTLFEHL